MFWSAFLGRSAVLPGPYLSRPEVFNLFRNMVEEMGMGERRREGVIGDGADFCRWEMGM